MTELEKLVFNQVQLVIALKESVELQAHYAELLNMHDGGARVIFKTPGDWIKRLVETGRMQPLEQLTEQQ